MTRAILIVLTGALIALAEDPPVLTLEQAEALAVKNHPGIASASFNAQAAGTIAAQIRSAYQPLLTGTFTSVGADRDTAIAAGQIQTAGLASRAATGVGFNQLLTDFGRTSKLADAARLRAAAQQKNVSTTRTQVLLQVDQAYYNALSTEAVLTIAKARVEMHRLTVRQVRALADSNLKSTLDVSFAEVSLSEAELALDQAENSAKASRALLAAAMGDLKNLPFQLADVPLPGRVIEDVESLVAEALKNRPEVAVAKLNQAAAVRFADAERRLLYPTVSVVGVVGVVPFHQSNFANQYSAGGLNISIPFLNGGQFSARRSEAEFRARGAEKDVEALALQIAGNVRVTWLEADTAWRRLDVTARLVDQTTTALRLAKTRYEMGLSGILELNQAQLALTSAQIAAASAKYDYLTRVVNLNFAIGAIR